MIFSYTNPQIWDIMDYFILKAFEILTQKSVVTMVIQGIVLAFSLWDKNSRLFVILAAIGVYSVYGSISMWVSIYRRELAARKLDESRKKQYDREINVRHEETMYSTLFIPVKEISEADRPESKIYLKNNLNFIYA